MVPRKPPKAVVSGMEVHMNSVNVKADRRRRENS